MHSQLQSGSSTLSERPTSPSLNGFESMTPNYKIQNFLIDSDLSSDEDNDKGQVNLEVKFQPMGITKGASHPNLIQQASVTQFDDDKSLRSESEKGQQDHELNKHQLTKMIDEKLKSE